MHHLSLLIKPASSSCNMRCKYCFYTDISNNRNVKSHGIMSEETLKTLVKNALTEAQGHCQFAFQGGEPTLAGLDFFQTLVAYVKQYNTKNVPVSYHLQTNGLLLNDAWAQFFKKHHFLLGLSIDAYKELHDFLRQDAKGKATHTSVLKAAKLLEKHQVPFNILSVITKQLAAHPKKVYDFYKKNNFRHIQFITCLDGMGEGHGTNPYSLSGKSYGTFLCHIFDLWYADFMKNDYYSIRLFDNYIYMLAAYPPESCAMGGVCTAYALVEANGDVYPCDFYAFDDYLLGNIHTHTFTHMLQGEQAQAFIVPSMKAHPDCINCPLFSLCRGGCRRDREPLVNATLSKNHYCEAYQMFLPYAQKRMESIARTMPKYQPPTL